MNVPSSLVREKVLYPALDARGENLRQQRYIDNDSPEIDSIREHVEALWPTASASQRRHLRALLRLTRDLADSNVAEGDCETSIAGVVDQLAADLRRAETQSLPRLGGSNAALALRLSKPLETIVRARKHDGTAYVNALGAVRDVVRGAGREALVDNAALRNTLGLARYDALIRILDGAS